MNRRLVGAGASGLAVVFAVVPFAHAEEPVDTTTSSTPAGETPSSAASTSAAPSSDTPTSDAPTSGTPTSDAPTGDTPTSDVPSTVTPSSDAPGSATPTSEAPSSGAPSGSTVAPPSRPAAPPSVAKRTVAPKADFGLGKSPADAVVTVRVDKAPGAYAPADANTGGSDVTIVQRDPADAVVSTTECTTVADGTGSGSSCPAAVAVPSGNTLQITQDSAAAAFVVAAPATAGPFDCEDGVNNYDRAQCYFSGTAVSVTVSLADAGLPPTVTTADTTVTVPADEVSSVDVDESQIDTQGAPPTSVDVTTEPTHGTVTVVSDAPPPPAARVAVAVTGPFHFVYTPTAGYVGPDSFAYSVTTANGTAGPVTVDLRVVGDAPTARNDTATTDQGDAVTVDALANDAANGGGTLALDAVTEAQHGNATIVDGKLRYTPAPDFSGTDSFTYSASTYSGTDTARVTITVSAAATPTPTPAPTTSDSSGAAPADDNVTTADTGTPSAALLEIGGALLLAGAGATVIGRRRRPSRGHA